MKIQALYVRVSTEAQAEEGFSIDAQRERLEAYGVAMGWENMEFYVDGGFSGSHLDRPQIQRLISDVKLEKLQSVAVFKLDRLSRSQKDTLFLIEDVFLPQKVDFISLNESIDTSTPYGRAMIGILSAFAQLERENIYLRTRMGMLERVKQGYWMGGGAIPFGYDYDKESGILVINPKESALVKQVFSLYLQGYRPQKIAELLGLGYERLVTQILKRRSYLGKIPYKGQEYEGRHEAIISEEIFFQAETKRLGRRRGDRCGSVHLLSGLIFCGECGQRLRYVKWGKRGYKLRCYSQDPSKNYMTKGIYCENTAVWAEEVEAVLVGDLQSLSLDFRSKKEILPQVGDLLFSQIRQQEGKLRRLYQLFSENTDDTLLELIENTRKTIESLKKQLSTEETKKDKAEELQKLQKKVATIGDGWGHLSLEQKQEILRECVDKIEIYPNSLNIYYKFKKKTKKTLS